MFNMSDRDEGFCLLNDDGRYDFIEGGNDHRQEVRQDAPFDFESQLIAADRLFAILKEAKSIDSVTVQRAESNIRSSDNSDQDVEDILEQEYIDEMHYSTYYSSVYCMALIGVLAPLMESLFKRAFANIRRRYYKTADATPSHIRFSKNNDIRWNCEYFFEKENKNPRKDIRKGINELTEAICLTRYLPDDCWSKINALFEYRNCVFHHGFEWPPAIRENFTKCIEDKKWDNQWFLCSTCGEGVWMYNTSPQFIREIYELIYSIVEGLGRYCKSK